MRNRFLLLLLLTCVTGVAAAGEAANDYQLYLVRHSEKQADDGEDPGLTDKGNQRSVQLAHWLLDKGITEIWSSDYRRSRDTAQPLASRLGLPVQLYDPRDLPALVGRLRENGHNALVVGHSNTTPDLARLLCVCYIEDMDESDYDQLIVVSVSGDDRAVEILSQATLFHRPGGP